VTGLTAAQTADGVGRLVWWSDALAQAMAPWDEPSEDDVLRVWVAGARRRLIGHAVDWRAQLPESVLLEPETRVCPGPGDEDRLGDVVDADDAAGFRRAGADALDVMVAVVDGLLADAGPVADASLRRVGAIVRADLMALTPPG